MSNIQFKETFGAYACAGQSIETEHNGLRFVATIHDDSDHGAPWQENDGHGPVSDWTRRDKRPGELLLNSDHGSKRYYDFQEACRIARRDGWGFLPARLKTWQDGAYWFACCEGVNGNRPLRGDDINAAIRACYDSHRATMSPREYAAQAAMQDFRVLKAWFDGQWAYCGIAVQVFIGDHELTGEYDHALWGIELNYPGSDNSYLVDVATEMAGEAIGAALIAAKELQQSLSGIIA